MRPRRLRAPPAFSNAATTAARAAAQDGWSALVRPGSTVTLARRQWLAADGGAGGAGGRAGGGGLPLEIAGLEGAELRRAVVARAAAAAAAAGGGRDSG